MAAIVESRSASPQRAVRFSFQAPPTARGVAVVGDFNAWNRYRHLMRRAASGVWETTLELAPGRYQYKFLVSDQEWFDDPQAQAAVPNEFGGTNAVVEVT